ncbi:hypothetical protein SKAU_G00325010 [Synaphobranchus kaupii]|uniref:Uncharacterized protein n=1 Tax=Synaphobranchus kaupii TaxID=118154 RepID=A0A9Q1EPL9_SYNKA|nr:hypothetical protein SKAU_G00325010 [Synaphobranchus kaupii]
MFSTLTNSPNSPGSVICMKNRHYRARQAEKREASPPCESKTVSMGRSILDVPFTPDYPLPFLFKNI